MLLVDETRKPNPLQVLLLTLVKYGLATPYELKALAGMSVGLTLGPLKRLQQAGLLNCESGTRNKLQYTLTQTGDDELRAALEAGKKQDWWLDTFGIYESLPRAILLAWLSSDLENAPEWLGRAAEDLLHEASSKEGRAEDLRRKMERIQLLFPEDENIQEKKRLIATTYEWIKTVTDAALLKVQAELVRTLTPVLLDLPPAPPLPDRVAGTQDDELDLN
jgi:DNA-binding PadR family transcriptional regulator